MSDGYIDFEKEVGNSRVIIQNIRKKHPLLQSGRLHDIFQEVASECRVEVQFDYKV